MRSKFALVGTLFLALAATVAAPSIASARSRFRVHVYFGTQPYYYYSPTPGYYYQPGYYSAPAPSYFYHQPVPRYYYGQTAAGYYRYGWRHDRGLHRGWYAHGRGRRAGPSRPRLKARVTACVNDK